MVYGLQFTVYDFSVVERWDNRPRKKQKKRMPICRSSIDSVKELTAIINTKAIKR